MILKNSFRWGWCWWQWSELCQAGGLGETGGWMGGGEAQTGLPIFSSFLFQDCETGRHQYYIKCFWGFLKLHCIGQTLGQGWKFGIGIGTLATWRLVIPWGKLLLSQTGGSSSHNSLEEVTFVTSLSIEQQPTQHNASGPFASCFRRSAQCAHCTIYFPHNISEHLTYIHPSLFGCEENIFLSFKLLICEFLSIMPVKHKQDVGVLCPV